jgi:hypothetical protein
LDALNQKFTFFEEERKNKEKPSNSGFRGELMEFNHSLAGFLFSRFLTGCSLPYFHKEKTGNHVFLNSYWLFPFWAYFSSILIGYFLFGPIFLL